MNRTLRCKSALLKQDLTGKTYVVTGANSGVGLATTEQLVRQGARVVAACRRVEAGREATRHLGDARGRVEVAALDLGSLDSVRHFAGEFLKHHVRLDGLVNNAGIMNVPEGRTRDGFEMHLGVNHLGHVLLTDLLLPVLQQSAPSRIVCVSSAFHVESRGHVGEIRLDDLNFTTRPYDPWVAYGQSKLANVLHAAELARRLEGTRVAAFSVHPGWVRSNLVQHTMPGWVQNILLRPFGALVDMVSPEDGAQTTSHCLLSPEALEHNGAYFSQKGIYPGKEDRKGGWPMRSPNPQAHDAGLAARLYDRSLELVGAFQAGS